MDYVLWVKEALKDYALLDNSGLAQGFNKSAQDIVINIAEGSARNKAQFVAHLKQAKKCYQNLPCICQPAAQRKV